MSWLKLSANTYPEAGRAALLAQLDPSLLDPEGVQDEAEAALAAHLGVPREWALLTSSCSAALFIAHHFLAEGRRLEAPVLTWPATYSYAKRRTLVDADPWPHWSDKDDVYRVGVDLWGMRLPDLSAPVATLDAAHNFGAGLEGLRSGHHAAVCYSFGPRKEVPCIRGGALISPHVDARWRAFRDSGTLGRYAVFRDGMNLEIAEPCAAMLIEQLKTHRGNRLRRGELLRSYKDGLGGLYIATWPGSASGHLCVVYFPDELARNAAAYALQKAEIQSGLHYPLPTYVAPNRFPLAWELSKRILSLPLHLEMNGSDVKRVCDVVKATI